MATTRILAVSIAITCALGSFVSTAEAKHRHHHAHARVAVAPGPVPAHQKPGYVSLASASLPGLIDLGHGPVFPFDGWPK